MSDIISCPAPSVVLAIPPGVPEWAWLKIARPDGDRWSIAERDATGEVIGTAYRASDGSKDFKKGSKRGIILAWPLDAYAGSAADQPVFVCEGASDTAAIMGLGLDAVGVPMAGHCGDMLAELLAERHVAIVADSDDAGRRGATKLAERIVQSCRSVKVIEPPEGAKDARDAVIAGANRDAFLALVRAAHAISAAVGTTSEVALKPLPVEDLLRDCPSLRPPVVVGLLRQGEVMNIVAAPKTGKSWLVHDLAVRVSMGRAWLRWNTIKTKVLIIDGELHRETLAYRLRKVRGWSAGGGGGPMDIDVCVLRGRRMTIDAIRDGLVPQPQNSYGLIIFDALYRFMPTDGEENSNETMTRVYNTLDAIAEQSGAAIVVVHHSSKGNQAEKAVTDVGAGAGAQSRAADTHLILRPHEREGAVVIDAVARSFTPVESFVVSRGESGWVDECELDPTQLKTARRQTKTDGGQAAKKPDPKVWTPAEFAEQIVGREPVIRDEVIARAKPAGITKTDAKSLINRGIADHVIYEHPFGQNIAPRIASVPPTLFSGVGGSGQGCGPPTAPGASAPGGCGGDTHTPPPPPIQARCPPYSQLEDIPVRKTRRSRRIPGGNS